MAATVDIVIPLYNKQRSVERTIRSILRQRFTDFNIIVVDDGSTDNGPEIVSSIRDDRIKLIHQTNQGPGPARNKGIEQAGAEFIAFLDADDQWYPWYLENALKAIKSNDVALVATMYYEWPQRTDQTKVWAKRKVYPGIYSLNGSEDPARADWLLCFMHVWNSLLRAETARKYGGFYAEKKCTYAEDTAFFLKIGINERFMIIGPAAVRYNRADSSLSNIWDIPLAPFFTEPDVVLRYCPPSKKDFLSRIIDHMALRTAQGKARYGLRDQAIDLLRRFPGAKSYRARYNRCLFMIAVSPILPYWVRFKRKVGPPMRLFLKSLLSKLGLIRPAPEI